MKTEFSIILGILLFCTNVQSQTINQDQYGIDYSVYVPKGLNVGDEAPKFQGADQTGKKITLDSLLNEGEVVLIFYRGVWCPVCLRYLSNLQDSLSEIESRNAKVVAVTPEVAEYVEKTTEKTNASFIIISDSTEQLMRNYDVWFEVNSVYERKVNVGRLADVAANNGQEKAVLPVPATFVINRSGEITYRHFDLNYKSRASVLDIINNLSSK